MTGVQTCALPICVRGFDGRPRFPSRIVKTVFREMLEMEMTKHIGAVPYERSKNRKGQSNGNKLRILRTRVGKLNLLVPQNREGTRSEERRVGKECRSRWSPEH